MTLLEQIKSKQLEARKARDSLASALLTTLIGDITTKSKNESKELSDAEVVGVIKKFITNAEQVAHYSDMQACVESKEAGKEARMEIEILKGFLPKQLNETELTLALNQIVTNLSASAGKAPAMGEVMKSLKALYEGQYDGAMASKIVKGIL